MTAEETKVSPTSDERTMAALAHFFGAIAALIIWALQKDKSSFVRFQAVQALAFGAAASLLALVLSTCLTGVMLVGMFAAMYSALNDSTSPESFARVMVLPFMFAPAMFVCIFPVSLAILIARVTAAISVISGKDFHYPILGAKVEKFLAD